MQEAQPQIHSVKAVKVSAARAVELSRILPTDHFSPRKVKKVVVTLFEQPNPAPNPNRGRLSGSARSLTFGAQTGRGSDQSCVVNKTTDYKYARLIEAVHLLAQNAEAALPYLGLQILKLEEGQSLNQHRDYHNHPDYPNHTMKFGRYQGGSLRMLRDGTWHSCDTRCQWVSVDALKVGHQVTPISWGERYSITLFTPGKLERLTTQDWDILAKTGFPICLYELQSFRVGRLSTPAHTMALRPVVEDEEMPPSGACLHLTTPKVQKL